VRFGDEFLARPEKFPSRLDSEPWGDRHVAIDFLGGPYLFSGLDTVQEEWVREQFASYETPKRPRDPPPVETLVNRAPAVDFKEINRCGWEYWLDVDYLPESVRVAGLGFMGLLEWQPALIGSLWTCEPKSGRFFEAMENLFRVMVAYRVLESGGILLHSAAIATDEGAYLFPGRSGAGKTTLSRFALGEGWQVLSDDLNVIAPQGGELVVEQVPFAGELGKSTRAGRSFPLKAVCRLRKSDQDSIAPLRPVEALGLMLSSSPNVNRDPYRSHRAEKFLAKVAGEYPAYELCFSIRGGLAGLKEILSRKV
jgi:hypothetical protein